MILEIPKNAETILHILEKAGYEAYVVGGCVRDSILGRSPDDWDITTSAKPEQVKALFHRTVDTGLQLEHVTKLLREHHYEIGNIDATIIAQKPKMAPHIPQMRANMAKAMGINESQLNIKATTEEKLGFTGREEGIASQAICLLNERKES